MSHQSQPEGKLDWDESWNTCIHWYTAVLQLYERERTKKTKKKREARRYANVIPEQWGAWRTVFQIVKLIYSQEVQYLCFKLKPLLSKVHRLSQNGMFLPTEPRGSRFLHSCSKLLVVLKLLGMFLTHMVRVIGVQFSFTRTSVAEVSIPMFLWQLVFTPSGYVYTCVCVYVCMCVQS